MITRVYAGRVKDRNILEHSSSGGAFTAISDLFLEKGQAVLCTGYDYELNIAVFQNVYTKEQRDQCRGSLYIQSIALESWNEAVQRLKGDKSNELVFFGVGCQSAAFQKYCEINKVDDQVTLVDIICHGSPSPIIWKDYIDSVRKGGKLSDVNFRDKRTGWAHSVGIAKVDGKEISLSKYRKVYSGLYTIRACCSSCPYTSTTRKSDITIGDFWHIEKSMPDFVDDMGTSLFLIHTDKGQYIFDRIKDDLEWRESNLDDCWQYNLEKPSRHSDERDAFWINYREKGIDFVMDRYGVITPMKRVKNKMRKIMGGYDLTVITGRYRFSAYPQVERWAA